MLDASSAATIRKLAEPFNRGGAYARSGGFNSLPHLAVIQDFWAIGVHHIIDHRRCRPEVELRAAKSAQL